MTSSINCHEFLHGCFWTPEDANHCITCRIIRSYFYYYVFINQDQLICPSLSVCCPFSPSKMERLQERRPWLPHVIRNAQCSQPPPEHLTIALRPSLSLWSSLSSDFMLSNILCLDSDACIWSATSAPSLFLSSTISEFIYSSCTDLLTKRRESRARSFLGGYVLSSARRAFSHLSGYGLSLHFLPAFISELLHLSWCFLSSISFLAEF